MKSAALSLSSCNSCMWHHWSHVCVSKISILGDTSLVVAWRLKTSAFAIRIESTVLIGKFRIFKAGEIRRNYNEWLILMQLEADWQNDQKCAAKYQSSYSRQLISLKSEVVCWNNKLRSTVSRDHICLTQSYSLLLRRLEWVFAIWRSVIPCSKQWRANIRRLHVPSPGHVPQLDWLLQVQVQCWLPWRREGMLSRQPLRHEGICDEK